MAITRRANLGTNFLYIVSSRESQIQPRSWANNKNSLPNWWYRRHNRRDSAKSQYLISDWSMEIFPSTLSQPSIENDALINSTINPSFLVFIRYATSDLHEKIVIASSTSKFSPRNRSRRNLNLSKLIEIVVMKGPLSPYALTWREWMMICFLLLKPRKNCSQSTFRHRQKKSSHYLSATFMNYVSVMQAVQLRLSLTLYSGRVFLRKTKWRR